MPLHMAEDYVENLKKLKALKFDWGKNEEYRYVMQGCKAARPLAWN